VNLKYYYLSVICVIVILAGCSKSENNPSQNKVEDKQVYICTGSSALRYHFNRSCPGLGKCKHTIIVTTLITAQKRGRTMCGWE